LDVMQENPRIVVSPALTRSLYHLPSKSETFSIVLS